MELNGKVALVTCGAVRLGRAMAEALAAERRSASSRTIRMETKSFAPAARSMR